MTWFKVLLTKEQIKAGEIKKLHQKFRDAFHEAGLPYEMGIFAGLPLNDGEQPFFLTPACSELATKLIADYSGGPCEKPRKKGLEPSLVIGFNMAWDLLLE